MYNAFFHKELKGILYPTTCLYLENLDLMILLGATWLDTIEIMVFDNPFI